MATLDVYRLPSPLKTLIFTKLLELSIGRDVGALKGPSYTMLIELYTLVRNGGIFYFSLNVAFGFFSPPIEFVHAFAPYMAIVFTECHLVLFFFITL